MVPDEEDPREVVMKYATQRKMVHWHDHSNIAGKQVICCLQCLTIKDRLERSGVIKYPDILSEGVISLPNVTTMQQKKDHKVPQHNLDCTRYTTDE